RLRHVSSETGVRNWNSVRAGHTVAKRSQDCLSQRQYGGVVHVVEQSQRRGIGRQPRPVIADVRSANRHARAELVLHRQREVLVARQILAVLCYPRRPLSVADRRIDAGRKFDHRRWESSIPVKRRGESIREVWNGWIRGESQLR